MGFHSNNHQDKCWSCEFFCGERKHKNGLLGESTETSSSGTCSCKRSTHFNKSVSESSWCSKYQKWGVLASIIAKKENEQMLREQRTENERAEREMQYEMQKERERTEKARRELEKEREALEQERKKLEYERWYSSLTPEEKAAENLRIEEEKKRVAKEEEEARKRAEREAEEREEKQRVEEAKTKRKIELLTPIVKRNRQLIGIMVGLSLVLMFIFSCITRCIDENYLITANSYEEYEELSHKINWFLFYFSVATVVFFILMSIIFQVYEIKGKTILAYLISPIGLWLASLMTNSILEIITLDSIKLMTPLFVVSAIIFAGLFVLFIITFIKKKKYVNDNKEELERLFSNK